jgi:hypothetical protein
LRPTYQIRPGLDVNEVLTTRGTVAQLPFDRAFGDTDESHPRRVTVATGLDAEGDHVAIVTINPTSFHTRVGDLVVNDVPVDFVLRGEEQIKGMQKALAWASGRLRSAAKDIKDGVLAGGVNIDVSVVSRGGK